MTWECKIKRADNGFIFMTPNEPDEEGAKPVDEYSEQLFEFPDETDEDVQNKSEAEVFVKLLWELSAHFAISLDKYNDYELAMEVRRRL